MTADPSATGPAVPEKRSVLIAGHGTSITMEDAFWAELRRMAKKRTMSVNQLITEIDKTRTGNTGNLSSAVRVFVLNDLLARLQARSAGGGSEVE